jgi:hypothetical protein
MIRRRYHHLILAVAVWALLASIMIFGREKHRRTHLANLGASDGGVGAIAKMPDFASQVIESWRAPKIEATGSWSFELFTPPAMQRDPLTNRFTLIQSNTRKTSRAADEALTAMPGDIEQDQEPRFVRRFQMLGYVKRSTGDIVGVFQNLETSEVCVSAGGALPAGWDATVEDLQLSLPQLSTTDGSAAVMLPRARARMRDDATGETYALSISEFNQAPETKTSEIESGDEVAWLESVASDLHH